MESLYPVLAGVIGAIASWNLSRMQERQKSKTFDLEYVRSVVAEQIKDLRDERDRNHAEIVSLRERMAVLEAEHKQAERARAAVIVRLQRENDELRQQNTHLLSEIEKLRTAS